MPTTTLYSRPVVVCVDDDPAILRSYGRVLRHEPYQIVTFDDTCKSLAWMERIEVDLVLTDERMPAMSGSELLDEVRRRSPRTRGVVITADLSCRGGAAWTMIAKPWDNQELLGKIRHLLSDREPWDELRWARERSLHIGG